MPRSPRHALIWSQDHARYELSTHGQLTQQFRPEEEHLWLAWLETSTSFAFHGPAGHLNVYQEARSRRGVYWYAYHTTASRTRKRYLGRTARVTFARLEQEAKALETEPLLDSRAPDPPLPEAEQRMALLVTKLSHPLLPSSLVARERLLSRLDTALSHPLTLLSASAGWGKTTLLSSWAVRSAVSIAWLSLDELDNDPTRFWVSVLAALRTCLPGVGETALAMLRSPQSPRLTTVLTTLLNELSGLAEPTVLLLDDYHVIEEQAIHDALLFLLEHLPAHVHLVLASRVDPPLALSRLRVRGHLLELRDADLRFQEEEAAHFLTHTMHLALEAEEVAVLAHRTEGWIAGLQLAALSMRQHQDLPAFVREFSGSHRYLLDYVQEEILAHLPVALQDFFLHTSILGRMTASLCQAVTTQANSQEFLETLERANLFLGPLDAERRWYRVHDLFREALLARLHATRPELVPLLHQRVARWYEAQGEWREAITHALAVPDYSFAASLMERAAEQFWLSGEARIVHTWVLALPDAVLFTHAHLALTAALHFLSSAHRSIEEMYMSVQTQVKRLLSRVEGILCEQPGVALSDVEAVLIRRRLSLLRALIEARAILKRGDKERLRLLLQEMDDLPQDAEVSWNMIPLSFAFWLTFTLQGEGAPLLPRLLLERQRALQAGDHLAVIRVRVWLALVYRQAGQLYQAHQECLEALAQVKQTGGHTDMEGYLHASLFSVYYAWNRLEEASDSLRRLLRLAQDWQQVDLLSQGESALIQISLATGDLATMQRALQKVEVLIEQEGFASHAAWLVQNRVSSWLAQGNLEAASAWAAQTMFHLETWDPLRKWDFLMLMRVFLAQQQYGLALETLERFSVHLDWPEDISTTISFLALYVVALHQARKREQAQTILARLLTLTEPEGYIRVYLDAGEAMREVLQMLLDTALPGAEEKENGAHAVSRASISRLLMAFAEEEKRRASRTEEQPANAQAEITQISLHRQSTSPSILSLAAGEAAPVLLEPLSSQEQRVLRLLVAGQTYAEIAEALIVSRNTIKTQVSSIYRKLGVNRRAEAIAVAQRWPFL
jgi:LuxR family maltose regulon positive regulatory protein